MVGEEHDVAERVRVAAVQMTAEADKHEIVEMGITLIVRAVDMGNGAGKHYAAVVS